MPCARLMVGAAVTALIALIGAARPDAVSAQVGTAAVIERVSVGPAGGNGSYPATLAGAALDGRRIFFATDEALTADDTDAWPKPVFSDIYERSGGSTVRVTAGEIDRPGCPDDVTFDGIAADGRHVFIGAHAAYDVRDTDCHGDVYLHEDGALTWLSRGEGGRGNGQFGATFRGASDDASHVVFDTIEQLTADDTDFSRDLYQRSGGVTTRLSQGEGGRGNQQISNDADAVTFHALSAFGNRTVFSSVEQLTDADTDTAVDLYVREDGVTRLISGTAAQPVEFETASGAAGRVFFSTVSALTADDTDAARDIYRADALGALTLMSHGEAGRGNGAVDVADGILASVDGQRLFFRTAEGLTVDDVDARIDVYERSESGVRRISVGEATRGNAARDAFLHHVSLDGSRVVVSTAEQLTSGDRDAAVDLYQIADGRPHLVSDVPDQPPSPGINAMFVGASLFGERVFFQTVESIDPGDRDFYVDIYVNDGGTLHHVSAGEGERGSGPFGAVWGGTSLDGDRAVFSTGEQLTVDDTDSVRDVYVASLCPVDDRTGDPDRDGLSTAVEQDQLRTNPCDRDTDGDGLRDNWEAPSGVSGAGFSDVELPPGVKAPDRDAVFGPYGEWISGGIGHDGRIPSGLAVSVRPSDPRHKDVYLELDWQDCTLAPHDCPELPPWMIGAFAKIGVTFPLGIDPTHHAPHLKGLQRVIQAFAEAPVNNPDGRTGINLHILVDERIPHQPNCDTGDSEARATRFGTVAQRGGQTNSPTVVVKRLVYRYVWSGHSSVRDTGEDPLCAKPSFAHFTSQVIKFSPLVEYDYSPFGSARIGGRDILVTLGPLWACPTKITLPVTTPIRPVATSPCRDGLLLDISRGPGATLPLPVPGIFPARLRGKAYPAPVHMMLGMPEEGGLEQLWSRALMHLLGHSLGIDHEATVSNLPVDQPGADRDGDGINDPTGPDAYNQWYALELLPRDGSTAPLEPFPQYDHLAAQDLDGDRVPEGQDTCPGIRNPGGSPQPDLDGDEIGDACDLDIDGDGKPNESDSGPSDSDDDGRPNRDDDDDDGDGIVDGDDNCPRAHAPGQADVDRDEVGDACDTDADADGSANLLELMTGSQPLSGASLPEFMFVAVTCHDETDNDIDGRIDGHDSGCLDHDGDEIPDAVDSCPGAWDSSAADADGDGTGDACEEVDSERHDGGRDGAHESAGGGGGRDPNSEIPPRRMQPKVSVHVVRTAGRFRPRGRLRYAIVLRNRGLQAVRRLSVYVRLPKGMTWVRGGRWSAKRRRVAFDVAKLAPRTRRRLLLVVRLGAQPRRVRPRAWVRVRGRPPTASRRRGSGPSARY